MGSFENRRPRVEKPKRHGGAQGFTRAMLLATLTAINAPEDAKAQEHLSGLSRFNRVISEVSVKKKRQPEVSSWPTTVTPAPAPSARQKEQSVKKSERTYGKSMPHIPTPEDVDVLNDYFALLKRMRGVYLDAHWPAVSLPQFNKFCEEIAVYCGEIAHRRDDVAYDSVFTPELFARIRTIHREVNTTITPKEDIKLYGVSEKWTIPAEAGDCEDYVLLKMIRLIDAGLDPKYLHILVVKDENKLGHAILAVDVLDKKVRNTLVLDNKIPDILTLEEMEQKYEGKLASFITYSQTGETTVQFLPYDSSRAAQNKAR